MVVPVVAATDTTTNSPAAMFGGGWAGYDLDDLDWFLLFKIFGISSEGFI